MSKVGFENSVPILSVVNLTASIDYYVNVLGFKMDWQYGGTASVSRDKSGLMLCEGAQGSPGTWVWIGVTDAERLFDEYVARGTKIFMKPTNFSWAYEFRIEDPDGHVLRFGSDPKPDKPFQDKP